MKLALAAGRLDYDDALDEITEQQFQQWRAFDRVETVGADRLLRVLAVIGAILANQWRSDESKQLTPQDILDIADGKPSGEEDEVSPEQVVTLVTRSLKGR